MAAMVRSGAVAIESLYQSAPFQVRTYSRRWATPLKPAHPGLDGLDRETRGAGDRAGCQHVEQVVLAAQADQLAWHQFLIRAAHL